MVKISTKPLKRLERAVMRKLIFLFPFVLSALNLVAQDTIPGWDPADSVMQEMASFEVVDSFLEEGHYGSIEYVDSVPKVDSGYYDQVQELFSSEDFIYDKTNLKQINFFKKLFGKIMNWFVRLFPSESYWRYSEQFYYLLSVVGLGLLGWIVYRLIFANRRLLAKEKKERAEESELRFLEKNLMRIDLIPYIDKAKKEEDYARAIRYLNLLNIQLLTQKGFVVWKHTKTNSELILEIQDPAVKSDFARNVKIFDRVWYGDARIDGELFEEYAAYFFNFQRRWR